MEQGFIDAVQAGIAQAVQAAGQAPPQQAAAFGLTPGRTNPDDIIDYSTKVGIAIWDKATAALNNDFDVESSQVQQLIEDLSARANAAGWNEGNGDIITIPDIAGNNHNLITNYGQLTRTEIRTRGDAYMGQNGRRAQNAIQMYYTLDATLTQRGWNKLRAESSEYQIGGEYHGPLFFKAMMNKAIVDNKSTASAIRTNLTGLDMYMINQADNNIETFNQYVKVQYEGLKARGETSPDLMINLFKGYAACADKEFTTYIKKKEDEYNEGIDITPEALMTYALNRYNQAKTAHKWCELTQEQEQIVALTAQVEQLKDKRLKLSDDSAKKKGKKKSNKPKDKKDSDDKFAWKKIPPRSNQVKTKTVDGKEYKWCKYHSAWVMHNPEGTGPDGCRLRKRMERNEATAHIATEEPSSDSEDSDDESPEEMLSNAVTAIMQQHDDDSDCE